MTFLHVSVDGALAPEAGVAAIWQKITKHRETHERSVSLGYEAGDVCVSRTGVFGGVV